VTVPTPRPPAELVERRRDPRFVKIQRRRGSTEARIATLKHRLLDGRCRAKGFPHRALQVAWAIFAHNLRQLTMIAQRQAMEKLKVA
jgi:hypothetical protein